ncbi:hypothetical protein OG585_15415 [Streptomyces sp. NBC_01340]|uniref:hypothetical protein n=1 Tax=unclassified Streptomyces TaxID=2593676 RepID=UPI002258E064|nr:MULTISPECIES: hypothetical protein [unclassified Streptomyces]MCX4454071.1 hypothetical protein [Streptomyces sp. NBC_01719]MCX4493431.1 hypothetical protein [Streptomyces sp. NBC_01728]WSI38555.1 hypothetical protein OG585_15415 [Streptomyces sp. NBC_01340]
MRAKRIIAVMASPLAAAALTFSPVLTAQAAAATTQAPEAQSPGKQGAAAGKAAGAKDGKRCNWGMSDNPEAKKSVYKKARDYQAYEAAYEAAYLKAYEELDNACDPNED